ncbi:ADP-ribosylglycohydrolase family protein, partial [Vibrio owensii]
MTHRNARSLHAIIGALVGDAASLGFHWLYDQELIRQFGSPHPEFHQPNRTEYHDKGYFAHGSKQVGDLTHYGAQLVAMLDALVQTGHYDEARYIRSFREWFDFGG